MGGVYMIDPGFSKTVVPHCGWAPARQGTRGGRRCLEFLVTAVGGISAVPLRFPDFLIHEPVRSVLLHGAGIPVTVPAPERYTIHKLILIDRRDASSPAKAGKDIAQAGNLISVLVEQLPGDLIEAWLEVWAARSGLAQGYDSEWEAA